MKWRRYSSLSTDSICQRLQHKEDVSDRQELYTSLHWDPFTASCLTSSTQHKQDDLWAARRKRMKVSTGEEDDCWMTRWRCVPSMQRGAEGHRLVGGLEGKWSPRAPQWIQRCKASWEDRVTGGCLCIHWRLKWFPLTWLHDSAPTPSWGDAWWEVLLMEESLILILFWRNLNLNISWRCLSVLRVSLLTPNTENSWSSSPLCLHDEPLTWHWPANHPFWQLSHSLLWTLHIFRWSAQKLQMWKGHWKSCGGTPKPKAMPEFLSQRG